MTETMEVIHRIRNITPGAVATTAMLVCVFFFISYSLTHEHRQSGVFQQTIPFFAVAVFTRGNEILPRARAASRARDNMVKRQITAAFAAILACFIVAQQDIGPSWLEGHTGHPYIG